MIDPNWYSNVALSGSGMEAMGTSDIRDAAASIAAFVAEQDIYISTDATWPTTAQRDTAVALTQAWFTRQVSGNVATVSVGKSARQFVRLPDGTWFEPGPGYATMTMTGARVVTEAMCPVPGSTAPNFALSRGWNYNQVGFTVTNAHGDQENFGFWVNHYDTNTGHICARQSGFRLNTWTFPQGVTATVNYAATTEHDNNIRNVVSTGPFASSSQPLGVGNTLGRSLAYTFDPLGGQLDGVSDGTRHLAVSGIASMTDPSGALTTFGYVYAQATGTLTRPVPFSQLTTIFTADNPTEANIEYDYDPLGQVFQVKDAEAIQVGDRAPYAFLIGDGTRGERDDPLGGAYSVTYDTYGHASRYQDELNRLTTVSIDSRSRPSQYTYPEGDQEF